MDILGILSLVFGAFGTLSSYWYIGIVPCAVGFVLGIVGMIESYMDSKTSIMGLLLSILGAVASVFFIVSDLDSGALALNAKRFGGEMISSEKGDDFMKFHREGWTPEEKSTENNEKKSTQEERPDYSEEIARMDWIHDGNESERSGGTVAQPDESVAAQPEERENNGEYNVEPREEPIITPEETVNYNDDVTENANNSSYNTISYEDIMRNPDGNKGKYCTVSGTVDQIIKGWFGVYSIFVVDANDDKWECVYSYKDGESHLMEGDYITVNGECGGVSTAETILGQQVTMPTIDVDRIN